MKTFIPYDRRGSKNPRWKGGSVTRYDGRVLIYAPNHPNAISGKYVLRYRLVMEATLGRLLEKGEVVHHVNGDPSDDRPENLVVTCQAKHVGQFHRTPKGSRWAKNFDQCVECRTSKVTPHIARGLCQRCYDAKRR